MINERISTNEENGSPEEMQKLAQSENRPKDLASLWMQNRMSMIQDDAASQQYSHLLISVEMGISMLEKHDDLRRRGIDFLKNSRSKMGERQVEYSTSKQIYTISGASTGTIRMRPEDLNIGIMEAVNQQAESELTDAWNMSLEVTRALVEEGLLRRKTYRMEDEATEKFLKSNFFSRMQKERRKI